jgi:hypothetical protein
VRSQLTLLCYRNKKKQVIHKAAESSTFQHQLTAGVPTDQHFSRATQKSKQERIPEALQQTSRQANTATAMIIYTCRLPLAFAESPYFKDTDTALSRLRMDSMVK